MPHANALRTCSQYGRDHTGLPLRYHAFADHFAHLIDYCRECTGVAHWVGTVGVGIVTTGHEFLEQQVLAIVLAEISETAFCIQPSLCNLNKARCRPHNTGFLVGGLTSSRDKCPQAADRVVEGGLSGVLYTAQVSVVTRLTQGVSPLGPRHLITQAERNIIRALDGRPPLEVLREDIGEVLYAQLQRLGGYLFVGLPTRDSDTDDYLVRHIVGIDPDSRLIAVGDHVEAGQPLMFCRRDGHSATKDMQRMLDALEDC